MPSRTPARRRAATAALFAGALTLALLAGEGGLALAGLEPRYHFRVEVPELVPWWQCEPGRGCRYRREFVADPERYNTAGFRDRDELRPPPEHDERFRILLLGDSFAYGASAYEEGQSFAEIVEDRLPALLWNTGIPGNGQRDEILALREFQPVLAPDLVLLAFYMNDFADNLYPAGQHYVFADGNWISRYERRIDGTARELSPAAAYRRVFRQAETPRQKIEATRIGTLVLRAARRLRGWLRDGKGESSETAGEDPGKAATRALLIEIRDAARDGGSDFLMLVIPSRADLETPTRRYADALELCRELALDCLEVRALLTPTDYDREHPLDSHWNTAGHAKVARELVEKIQARTGGEKP